MPDVVGKSVLEANRLITAAGFNVRLTGAFDPNGKGGAVVVNQSLVAGSNIARGSVVEIELRYMEKDD